jgi:hypothetical protein
MNELLKKSLSGAASGFVAAVIVDLNAFQNSPGLIKTFDWKLALTRWLSGSLSGALAGAGLGSI